MALAYCCANQIFSINTLHTGKQEMSYKEKEDSEATNNKTCWTQSIWKSFPLWHSKIFTHENKAHLWSSKYRKFAGFHCPEMSVENLQEDTCVHFLQLHLPAPLSPRSPIGMKRWTSEQLKGMHSARQCSRTWLNTQDLAVLCLYDSLPIVEMHLLHYFPF